MSARQRQKAFTWAANALFVAIGKAWNGAETKLEPDAGLAAEGYEPGRAPNVRVFNWLFSWFALSLNRLRNVDLANWRLSGDTTPTILQPWAGVGYDAGALESTVVIVSADGQARGSTDGLSWTDVDAGNNLPGALRVVAYVGGTIDRWLALGDSTIHRRVRDLSASAWASVANPVASNWQALASSTTATEKVVIVGTNGKIASSSAAGASAFTNRSPVGTDDFFGVCFGAGLYVVVGEAGRIFTSADGITWTARTSGTSTDLKFVFRDDRTGVFLAIAIDGTTRRSTDGITWTAGTALSGAADNVVSAAHDGEGTILAVRDANADGYGSTTARRSRVFATIDGGATWELVGKIARDFIPRSLVWAGDLGWVACGGDNFGSGVVFQSVKL